MEVKVIPKKTVTVIPPKNKFYVDKEKYNQKRVAAYCRVSTDSEEQLTSYNTQKKVYTEMILSNKEGMYLFFILQHLGKSHPAVKREGHRILSVYFHMLNDCREQFGIECFKRLFNAVNYIADLTHPFELICQRSAK